MISVPCCMPFMKAVITSWMRCICELSDMANVVVTLLVCMSFTSFSWICQPSTRREMKVWMCSRVTLLQCIPKTREMEPIACAVAVFSTMFFSFIWFETWSVLRPRRKSSRFRMPAHDWLLFERIRNSASGKWVRTHARGTDAHTMRSK
jgi:hypothetical protein